MKYSLNTAKWFGIFLFLTFIAGCASLSSDNANVRAYDQTRYFKDDVTGREGVSLSRTNGGFWDTKQDTYSLQIGPSLAYRDGLELFYTFRAEDWAFLDTAYMNGRRISFTERYRKVDSDSSGVSIREHFSVTIPLNEAITGSCEVDGLKIAFEGEGSRVNLHVKQADLQGFLKKAKDLKMAKIEGSCFDLPEEQD